MSAIPPVDGLTIGAALRRAAELRMVRECTMLVPREHFDAEATLERVERERATALYGVPTMFVAELEHETFADDSVEILVSTVGRPLPGVEVRVVETIPEGGWLRTGDLAVSEANGYYRVTGRINDMIKVPRYVKFVDEFPLPVTGKVQKFRIREMAIEEYGLGPGHGNVAYDDKTDTDAADPAGSR